VKAIDKHGSLKMKPEELLADGEFQKLLKKSLVSDITEFGRMTHAEMSALMDAVRLGRSVDGSTIYVTTYACIIAQNISSHLVSRESFTSSHTPRAEPWLSTTMR